MKINFTKKEYEALVNMIYIADWVLHAHTVGESEDTKVYNDLEQKILAHAKDYGREDLVDFDPTTKLFYPSRKLEEGQAHSFIDKFEEDTFWEELVNKLSWRDLIKKYGQEAVAKMEFLERLQKTEEFEEKYNIEFEENGLGNLVIKK